MARRVCCALFWYSTLFTIVGGRVSATTATSHQQHATHAPSHSIACHRMPRCSFVTMWGGGMRLAAIILGHTVSIRATFLIARGNVAPQFRKPKPVIKCSAMMAPLLLTALRKDVRFAICNATGLSFMSRRIFHIRVADAAEEAVSSTSHGDCGLGAFLVGSTRHPPSVIRHPHRGWLAARDRRNWPRGETKA